METMTQAAILEIRSASSILTDFTMQITATVTSYQDALKNAASNPIAGANTLDARVQAREGIKAQQVLVDAPSPGQQIHSGTDNTRLVEIANSALTAMEDQSTQRFVSAWRLNNGGLLLEMDSEDAAKWLDTPSNRTAFLSHFAPEAALKARTYSLVVQFMPLQFKPDKDADLCSLEVVNRLPTGLIRRARWIKPAYRRAPEQTCGHLLVVMTRPEDANTVLTDGLLICQKRVYAEKCKKEPT